MNELLEKARRLHPERFAPDGEPLAKYRPLCLHENGPCLGGWAERLARWEREQDARAAAAPAPRAEVAS